MKDLNRFRSGREALGLTRFRKRPQEIFGELFSCLPEESIFGSKGYSLDGDEEGAIKLHLTWITGGTSPAFA